MKPLIPNWVAMLALLTTPTATLAKNTEVVITVKKSPAKIELAAKLPFAGQRASVDVAILLDTSNSMDGLINQAKSQLWTIVQQFAKAKKNGQTPVLRVALFEYGNTRLPAAEGYLRQVVPLSDDLDKLSQALFGLSTSGGDEYCGQVLREALLRLEWSKEPNAYKAIFIAGNERFTQGAVDYRESCQRAIEMGIVVNTIHCGSHSAGVDGQWQQGALLAEGEFFNIDQDRAIVHIKCPQDEIILRLNAELNKTYLWYGNIDKRKAFAENQLAQDSNAASAGEGVAVGRVLAKSGAAYRNVARCLVDTFGEDDKILTKVKEKQLPDVLQTMPSEKREAYVKALAAQRNRVQMEIAKVAAEREAYLSEARQRLTEESGQATLGNAIVSAIVKQLAESGFATSTALP
ncbi:MAG: VWA domain-containing protein [Pirellulales bacterium]|nr:VWA domain-containing protein [Pirellulales bacterium]